MDRPGDRPGVDRSRAVGTIIWLILGAVSLVGIYNIIGGNSFMQNLLSGLDLPPLGSSS